MQLHELTENEKKLLSKLWRELGASVSKISSLESCLFASSGAKWYKVVDDDNKTLAIFEVLRVPINGSRYYKNMRIDFAPDLDIKEEGESFESAKRNLEIVVEVLSLIFATLVVKIEQKGEPDTLKIFNDDDNVRTIFYKFAEFLSVEYPEKYSATFYNKWIEITAK